MLQGNGTLDLSDASTNIWGGGVILLINIDSNVERINSQGRKINLDQRAWD